LPVVSIHESRLAQLLQNLISNAVKYRSEEPVRIHVAADERDGWCVFSVADNGIGIDPKFADQIFGLFKRLHSRDRYQGSGIGLAICQRIVEQYGGRIWLDKSVSGQGSTFCFSIPGLNR
jgi:signal transduction histidine kinase